MKATRWLVILAAALAAGCGEPLKPNVPPQEVLPAGWEVVQPAFRVASSGGLLEVFRYAVPGGWVYVTYTWRSVGTTFVPNAK